MAFEQWREYTLIIMAEHLGIFFEPNFVLDFPLFDLIYVRMLAKQDMKLNEA